MGWLRSGHTKLSQYFQGFKLQKTQSVMYDTVLLVQFVHELNDSLSEECGNGFLVRAREHQSI